MMLGTICIILMIVFVAYCCVTISADENDE